jgi:hypothetical protein
VVDSILEGTIDVGALGVNANGDGRDSGQRANIGKVGISTDKVSDLVEDGSLDVEVDVVQDRETVVVKGSIADNGKAMVGALDVDREAVVNLDVDGEVKAKYVESTAEDGGVTV